MPKCNQIIITASSQHYIESCNIKKMSNLDKAVVSKMVYCKCMYRKCILAIRNGFSHVNYSMIVWCYLLHNNVKPTQSEMWYRKFMSEVQLQLPSCFEEHFWLLHFIFTDVLKWNDTIIFCTDGCNLITSCSQAGFECTICLVAVTYQPSNNELLNSSTCVI